MDQLNAVVELWREEPDENDQGGWYNPPEFTEAMDRLADAYTAGGTFVTADTLAAALPERYGSEDERREVAELIVRRLRD